MRDIAAHLLTEVAPAAVVMVVTLAAWGVSLIVEARAGQHVDLVVMTVAIAVTLARGQLERPAPSPWLFLAVPPAAALASYVGSQMARDHRFGDTLFVVVLTLAVWVRRFGPSGTALGTLVTLPLVAALVTPYVPAGEVERASWSAVLGAVCALFTALAVGSARRLAPTWFARRSTPRPPAATGDRRIAPSTRMAVQLAVALTLGIGIGRHVHADHWQWPVLTAYIVSSANQGRADVLYKGIQRGVGAAAGTVVAALLTGTFGPGDHRAVAYIFAVLGLALVVRRSGYGYWAGAVTAALALVYGYFGQGGTELLEQRLVGIGLGAVAGIAAAWFVLPIRTGDVLRRRTAALLEALQNLITLLAENPAAVGAEQVRPVVAADLALTRVMQPLTARGRWLRRLGRPDRLGEVVTSAAACAENARSLVRLVRTGREPLDADRIGAGQTQVLANLGALRRSLRSRERAQVCPLAHAEGATATGRALALLGEIDRAATTLTAAFTR